MDTHLHTHKIHAVLAGVLVVLMFSFFAPTFVFAGAGGGADGDGGNAGNQSSSQSASQSSHSRGGGLAASIGRGLASIGRGLAAVGHAVASGIASVGNAVFGGKFGSIAGFNAASSMATTAGKQAHVTNGQLNGAPTVTGATGTVVGHNSAGQSVVDQGNGMGLAAVGTGGGGNGTGGGGVTPPTTFPTVAATVPCTSPVNACGASSSGTRTEIRRISDNSLVSVSTCSASTPAVPSYVGTSCSSTFSNVCGYSDIAYGTNDCSNNCGITYWPPIPQTGTCTSTTTPAVCPTGFTGTPPSCTRSVCPTGTVGTPPSCVVDVCPSGSVGTPPSCVALGTTQRTIAVQPTLVKANDVTTITWNARNVTGCSVSADKNNDSWSGMSGRYQTSPIATKTVYTITCSDRSGVSLTASTTVHVVPTWGEF